MADFIYYSTDRLSSPKGCTSNRPWHSCSNRTFFRPDLFPGHPLDLNCWCAVQEEIGADSPILWVNLRASCPDAVSKNDLTSNQDRLVARPHRSPRHLRPA